MLLLGVVLAVFQQWCGINVIFNYAEEIFRAAGYDISDVLQNIAWTGSVNLVFTFVALGIRRPPAGAGPLMLLGRPVWRSSTRPWRDCYHAGVQGCRCLLLVLAAIGCLCDVARAGHLGGDFRDLSQPDPRLPRCRSRSRPLDRVFRPDLHVSAR